jgi:hypothetical protein
MRGNDISGVTKGSKEKRSKKGIFKRRESEGTKVIIYQSNSPKVTYKKRKWDRNREKKITPSRKNDQCSHTSQGSAWKTVPIDLVGGAG